MPAPGVSPGTRKFAGILLVLALLFIGVATLTPGNANVLYRPATFWCWACGTTGGADATLNVWLFVPFGLALGLLGVVPIRTMLVGVVVSMLIEFAQYSGWPPSRVANASDVIANTLGAFAGGLLGTHWPSLVFVKGRSARAMAAVATFASCAVFAFSAWALGREVPRDNSDAVLAIPRRTTEGFGWYHGRVLTAEVHGVSIEHSGNGPLVLSGRLRATDTVRVRVAGRDERTEFVPMVTLDQPDYSPPRFMLGQMGDAASMRVKLRASRLRLALPQLALPDVFAGQTDTLREIRAVLSRDGWTIDLPDAPQPKVAHLRLSLSLGWTLFQDVVHVWEPSSALVSLGWLFSFGMLTIFWVPALSRPTLGFVLAGGTLALTMIISARIAGLAGLQVGEWCATLGGMGCGVLAGARVVAHRRSHQ